MIRAGHDADVLDVIGHVLERSGRRRVLGLPALQRRGDALGLPDVETPEGRTVEACLLGSEFGTPAPPRLGDVVGQEINHHDTAVGCDQPEHRVAHIARMIYQRARRGVREDDRRRRHPQRRAHGLLGDVRQVDQHAEAVHLAHYRLTEGCEPMVRRGIGGGIRPGGVGGVGERHVARAEVVVGAQHRERVIDLVATLHADQAGDAMRAMLAQDVGRVVGHRQVLRVARAHRLDELDLLERRLHGRRALNGRVNEHRPELRPHPSGAQPRDVGHERRLTRRRGQGERGGAQIDAREIARETRPDLPGQVVMPVDERRLREDALDARAVRRRGRRHRAREQQRREP